MNKRPIIRFVTGSFLRGGAERTLKVLAVGLDPTRYDVRVTCFLNQGPYRDEVEAAGIPIHDLAMKKLWSADGLRRGWSFAAMLRRERPAIVQSFGYGADVLASIAGRGMRVPWVITTRRSTGVDKSAHRWVYAAINPLAHRVLAVSEESGRWSVDNEWLSAAKVHAIPNGVDAAQFQPGMPLSASDGIIRIGTVGNVRPAKGIDLLFNAFAHVRTALPNLPIQLLIAGQVRDSVKEEVDRLLDQLGIRSHVEFMGQIDDVPEFLQSLDVFALPSLREGMSNALLEAIATGLPVVATAVGGNIENVRDGEGGMLIRDRNDQRFGDALIALVSDESLRRRFGNFNRELAVREYSVESVVDAHAAYYDSLLRERS